MLRCQECDCAQADDSAIESGVAAFELELHPNVIALQFDSIEYAGNHDDIMWQTKSWKFVVF